MIETLDDIVEQLADWCGAYGCGEEDGDHAPDCRCRICFTLGLKARIREAVAIEIKLKQEVMP